MGFKDFAEKELQAIFCGDEFETIHFIDGQQVAITIDNDRLKERVLKEYESISVGEILYFVPVSKLKKKPVRGGFQMLDGRQYIVFDVREDNGLLEVILTQNRG